MRSCHVHRNRIFSLFLLGLMLPLFFSCKHKALPSDASGIFEAREVIVASEVGGKLLHFKLEEGEEIVAGKEIALIDTTQLYLKIQQLLATAHASEIRSPDEKKQLAALEEQIINLHQEVQRFEKLLSGKAVSQKQLDDLKDQLVILQKQKEALQSNISKSKAGIQQDLNGLEYQIAQLQDQLQKCHVRNPIMGRVLVKYVEESEVVPTGKALYKIADLNQLFVRAYVTADQLSKISLGQEVVVYSDDANGGQKSYAGHITWISSQAEFTPKTIQTRDERAHLVYAVKIAVKNDGLLKIGMYAEVVFTDKNRSL